jgi:putative Mg2+ transporter-C (MgtC) family protein
MNECVTWTEFTLRMGCALALGAGIGMERSTLPSARASLRVGTRRQRRAGLRTNALVSVGAALFVMLSAMTPHESSPTRIAAQVVSGVGFLGAGVILREGLNITRLNTAATLWCAAAVGLLSGAGFLLEALTGAVGIVMANLLLRTTRTT